MMKKWYQCHISQSPDTHSYLWKCTLYMHQSVTKVMLYSVEVNWRGTLRNGGLSNSLHLYYSTSTVYSIKLYKAISNWDMMARDKKNKHHKYTPVLLQMKRCNPRFWSKTCIATVVFTILFIILLSTFHCDWKLILMPKSSKMILFYIDFILIIEFLDQMCYFCKLRCSNWHRFEKP